MKSEDINTILDILEQTYPEADCALDHTDIFELLICVVLSAQTTDKSVNKVTPALFAEYPDAAALSQADPEDVAEYIRSIGMYKTKSKNIVNLAKALVSDFGGNVPDDYASLISLPGVGRKTANVVLSAAMREGLNAPNVLSISIANTMERLNDQPPVIYITVWITQRLSQAQS